MKCIVECFVKENFSQEKKMPFEEKIVLYAKKHLLLTKDRFRALYLATNAVFRKKAKMKYNRINGHRKKKTENFIRAKKTNM